MNGGGGWSPVVLCMVWLDWTHIWLQSHPVKTFLEQQYYHGPQGGPKAGPTRYIVNLTTPNASLPIIFFGILPCSTFDYIRDMAEKYCYHNFVVREGSVWPRRWGKEEESTCGLRCWCPGARQHCVSSKSNNWSNSITSGSVLAWFAMLILQGAHFGTNKCAAKKMWRSAPHGHGLAYVRNSVTDNALSSWDRSFIICQQQWMCSEGPQHNNDPLLKVQKMLNTIMDGICRA